jgi:serine/threonine protein kinase
MTAKIELLNMIGKGSFGSVYECKIDNELYALKIESSDVKVPQLAYEYKILRHLKKCKGVPAAYFCWNQPFGEIWMAIQLLGVSLEKQKPRMDELLRLAPEYIRILESIHKAGFLHRDIKPENMLRGKSGVTYWLVDYGLAKKYITSDKQHIPHRKGKAIVGTPRYISRHIHAKEQSSRRDDLESLGYAFIYLARHGELPWISIKPTGTDKIEAIAECKANTSIKELCSELPKSFEMYMQNVYELEFAETPNYDMLVGFFESL